MTNPSCDSPSADVVKFFNFIVFTHFSLAVSVFLVASTGFAVGFAGAFGVAAIAAIQATSLAPGFLYVYNPSKLVLSGFIASHIVLGAAELGFAVFLFFEGKIVVGLLLILLAVLQGFEIVVAFVRPQVTLPKPIAGFVKRISAEQKEKTLINHESGLKSVRPSSKSSKHSKRRMDCSDKLSVRASSPSVRSLPRSDMATSNLQLSKESIPEKAGDKNKTADAQKADSSASGASISSRKEVVKMRAEHEPTSTDRISEETKSLQSIADQSRIPVVVDRDLSNSIEQYLFEECIQIAEKQTQPKPPVSVLPPDICSSLKTKGNAKGTGHYELIQQAKNSSVKENIGKKTISVKNASKTTPTNAKKNPSVKAEKTRYPDGISISDSSEESRRKQRWKFVQKK